MSRRLRRVALAVAIVSGLATGVDARGAGGGHAGAAHPAVRAHPSVFFHPGSHHAIGHAQNHFNLARFRHDRFHDGPLGWGTYGRGDLSSGGYGWSSGGYGSGYDPSNAGSGDYGAASPGVDPFYAAAAVGRFAHPHGCWSQEQLVPSSHGQVPVVVTRC